MPIKKEKLDSIKGYREYQKKSGAAAAVSSPAPSSYAPAQKPARVKQDKREQIYTYYRSVSTPKMTAQEEKATSPMFRQQPTMQQNVVTPKNQSALAQNLAQGALQKKDAKNYQSKEAFEQHVQEVKAPTVAQRVGNTLKGAAKTYGAGLVNLAGMAQTGSGLQRREEANTEIALWDQDIKAQRDVLADPMSTESERDTARNVIAALEARKAAYLKAYGEGGEVERTAQGIYSVADKLSDSGTRDIERAKKDLGAAGRLAVDVGVAGAQMGADAALGLLTGGSALPAMFVRSTGGSAQEARRAGATHQQQVNYGFASGALSVATEKIGNAAAPFKKMFGKGFLDGVIERTMSGLNNSAAGKIALSFLEEGGEEAIEDLIQPALQIIYNGKTLGGSYSELEASEILNDFLVGGILGGLGGGVEVAANRFARFDNSLGESGRKAIRGSYQEGKDAAEHVKDFIPAYNAGVEGKANPNPTNETAYAGYIAGQNDAKKSAGTGEHIDSRTKENVSSRNVNAFQFDHPELHGYYSTAAEQIAGIADISLSRGQQKGARQRTANGYQRSNQIFETPAMRKAMDEGLTRTQIIDAAQRIINDNGQENVKAAKTLEIVLDDMLTNGYTAVDGTAVAPNTDYIAAKQQIAGAEVQATGFDKYVTDNRLALETGEVTMDELRAEYAQQEGAEHGEAVHLRDGSERDNGANPRGEVRGVEESTGRDQSRKKGRHFADSEAAALDYGEKVSTASFGIGRGAFNDSVYLVKNETAEMRKAKDLAKERGLRVTFFAGNNLTFRDKSGKTFQVRGYVSGDRVFIRADHPEFTSYQIMRHEAGHDMIAKGEVDLNEVRTRIDKTFTGGEVDSLCTAYADAYAGTEMTAQEIWEEVVCDSLGDMNIFADSEISDAAAFLLAHIKVESETVAQESTRAPPSKINGRASIEEAADGKKYVRADRQVIFGNDPQSWSEQLEDYINGKIRRGQDVKLIGADGDELALTATSAGKLSDNHTSDGRTMSEAAFERKVNAASHIDELAQISVKGDRNVVDHNSRHGGMASGGWNYRTAFFKDFDGKYYKITISTAQSADGRMIYNIGKMQERSTPQIDGSSTANSGALRGDALEDSLSRDTQNVKSKFSMETPVEETKTLVAMHNMTEEKLRRTLDIGAWPSPSIAVVKAKEGHANYGEYSAIFPRGTIDPQADSRNKVYGGDAWTPTHDNALVEREVNYEARRAFDENIKNLSSQFAGGVFQGSGTLGKIGLENETRWEPEEIADKLANHPEVQAAFRKEGYAISDGHAKSILALIDRAANIPTGYYEAKPQRVVGFDEALAVIAPDDAPVDLLSEMRNAGMNVVEYKAGDDADRLAKVNGVNDAQFSREIPEENYEALKEKYGYIPAGERAYREVQVPKKTADDKYVSRTIRTVLEAKATPDAMVPTLERMVAKGDFSYDRYTDKQAISDAESRIKTEGWQKTLNKWKSSTKEGISKENTAIGWALYNNAANSGDVETAIDVLDTIVKRQRNAAQALQATRLLKQQDPSTQLYAAQRSVENLTEDLKKQYGEKAPDLKIDRDLAEKFLNAKDDDARTEAMKEIYRDIGRQMPSRFIDKWNAWRYFSMLGNPRTHVRNIVGNVGFVPAVTVKNVIGAGIESAANAVSGGKVGRTKAILTTKDAGLIKAAWSDYANIREQALGSGKYNDNVNVRQEIEEGRTIFKPKLLEAMRKFNSTALDAEDAWFSKPHYAAALAQFCKANGITAEQVAGGKGIEAAREYAIREAQKATYRDTNAFSQMISDLGRYRGDNKMKRLGSTLAEGILPFRKTPANILVRGVEYSPIGFLKSISYDLVQVQKGNMQATEMIDRAAAGLTGTGLMMLGLYMAKEGILRGSGGDDEKKKKFDELQGHQEYALELPNGTSITLDWLAPEALPFFVGANLYEQMQANNGYLTMSDMLQAASNVTDPLLSMSCLQSLNDVFDAVGYASSGNTNALTSAVASAATSYLTQGIPTVFGQAERTGESTRMTTYTDKNKFLTPDMQYALGKASARIPGVDYGQIPFIDAWGRTENSGGVAARAFNNFANPAYTSKVSGSKMEDELSRLYEATGETKVLPQRAPKFFTVNKENKQLTGEEYVKYATKRGQTSHKIASELTGLASYKSMSDGDKADAVAKAYEYANVVGKMSVSSYQPDGWVAKAVETVKKTGVSEAQYIVLYLAKGGIESLKDKNGDTISNSEGLQIMELVYQQKGLSDEQRAALFEDFGVGKSIRHWNRARVDEQLAIARKKAA